MIQTLLHVIQDRQKLIQTLLHVIQDRQKLIQTLLHVIQDTKTDITKTKTDTNTVTCHTG